MQTIVALLHSDAPRGETELSVKMGGRAYRLKVECGNPCSGK